MWGDLGEKSGEEHSSVWWLTRQQPIGRARLLEATNNALTDPMEARVASFKKNLLGENILEVAT